MQNPIKFPCIRIEQHRPSDAKAVTMEGALIKAVSVFEGKAVVELAYTSAAAEALFAVLQKVYRLEFFALHGGREFSVYARLINSQGSTRNIQVYVGDVLILSEPDGDPEHYSRSRANAKFSITSPEDKRANHTAIKITDALEHSYEGVYFNDEEGHVGIGVTTNAVATFTNWVDSKTLTQWEGVWYFNGGHPPASHPGGEPRGRKMEAGDLILLYSGSDPFVMSAGLVQVSRMQIRALAAPVARRVVEEKPKEKQQVAIIITGETGSGKTALSAKLAHMLSDAGFEVVAQDLQADIGLMGRDALMESVKNYVPTKEYIVSEHRIVQRFSVDPARPLPLDEAMRVYPAPVRDLAHGVTNIAIVAAPHSGKTALVQQICNYLVGGVGIKEDAVFMQQLPDGGNNLYPATKLDDVLTELSKHFRIAIFERGSTTNATLQSVLKSCGANGI
jgi:hypothetical protein